jgi:hypothetical protein
MPACSASIDLGGTTSSEVAEEKTAALEGEWTLAITDSVGEYENLIEFSDTGEILHWYDQYGDDFYSDLEVGYSEVSVSATNLVSLELQYEYNLNDALYSAKMSLVGLMSADDTMMDLDGETLLSENGVVTDSQLLSVHALRGNDAGGDIINDGLFTESLEGTWYFTITDLVGTGIHSIEFDESGKMLHWVTPYGTDITRLDPASDLQAYVSSSYDVHLAGQYTFEHEGSTFSVSLELSGDMDQATEYEMSLNGLTKIYSDGYLISLLHSPAAANRSTLSGANDNAKFSFLEGEWVFVVNNDTGVTIHNITCHANGDILSWLLFEEVNVFDIDTEALAMVNISSDDQAYSEMDYAMTSITANGVFNSVNNNFMQMAGTQTWGTYSLPTFVSAFRASLLATSMNNTVWPIKAAATQLTGIGYGPLYSPWSRD